MSTTTERDNTPCYVPFCPECRGIFGAAVADVRDSICMAQAMKARRDWEKRGYVVEVHSVQWFRESKDVFRHRETCSKFKPSKPANRLPL